MITKKKINPTRMSKVSFKRLKTIFKPRFIDNRTNLHLLSLGIGGGIKEKIESQNFIVQMDSNNKIYICDNKSGVLKENSTYEGYQSLLNHMKTDMFMNLLKIKRRHGSFRIEGELIYAPSEFYDDDNTVTLEATKYHRVRMGYIGTVILTNFISGYAQTDQQKEDMLKEIQVYFNINSHRGFKSYLSDELIPDEDTDTIVDIPENCDVKSIPRIIEKLAENTKSNINGKMEVKGCEVKGYTFYANGIPYFIENKRWRALNEKYLEKYTELAELYGIYRKSEQPIGYDEINRWVKKCEDFLNDTTVPRGVRFTKKERIMRMLPKLSQNIPVGDYLRFSNRLLSTLNK